MQPSRRCCSCLARTASSPDSRAKPNAFSRALWTSALAAGDHFRALQCVVWDLGAKTFGAAPLTEIEAALAEIPDILQPTLAHTPLHHMHLALTHGYAGRFEEARVLCREASRLASELGQRVHGAASPCSPD